MKSILPTTGNIPSCPSHLYYPHLDQRLLGLTVDFPNMIVNIASRSQINWSLPSCRQPGQNYLMVGTIMWKTERDLGGLSLMLGLMIGSLL
jgi:hypothetical protein